MSRPLACSSAAASVGSNPTLDSSSQDDNDRIKLRMDGDDPYVGFEELSPLQCYEIEEDEEVHIAHEGNEFESAKENGQLCVGMEFETAQEAFDFYNAYAAHVGFSFRRNNQKKSKDRVTFCRFVCNKAGFSKLQIAEQKGIKCATEPKSPQRERGTTRTNCKASISVKLVKEGCWQISVFHADHNHPLLTSPSKSRNLRSQKLIDQEEDEIIYGMSTHNIGTSQIYEFMATKRGGKKQLRYKKKDVNNRIATKNRQILGMDVGTTLAYFREKQQEDPEFFYAIDADEDGLTRHIFWIDGRGRRAYLEFGDVVTFDTTYNTNRYNMPLAPFIGVNHHRHSIFYGVALIRSEKEMNFTWLFETFLKVMYGKHPRSILTDQDPAMKNAIKVIFS